MARQQLQIPGSTPLADTGAGTAGTVTGAERKRVQDIHTGTYTVPLAAAAVALATGTDRSTLDYLSAVDGATGQELAATLGSGGNVTLTGSMADILTLNITAGRWLVYGGLQLQRTADGTVNYANIQTEFTVNGVVVEEGDVSLLPWSNNGAATYDKLSYQPRYILVPSGTVPVKIRAANQMAGLSAQVQAVGDSNPKTFIRATRIG